MSSKRPVILVPTGYYLPGFKAGGQVRSIANMVDSIGSDFDFRIVCLDRDLGDAKAYSGISTERWVHVGKAKIYYTQSRPWSFWKYLRVIRSTPHDLLYFNSVFSVSATIVPLFARRIGLLPAAPIVLAPRGEFSEGALALKSLKKRIFMAAGKAMNLYSDIVWQASSAYEVADIKAQIGSSAKIVVAADLPTPPAAHDQVHPDDLPSNALRVVLLSRISPMKNIDYAIRVLQLVRRPVTFSIYGPTEDPAYFAECVTLAEKLPKHVDVRWHGAVAPAEVPSIMAAHDLFFLPTRGENFGHVIAEALGAGTPVLVSDRTPWRGLQGAGVGWDLPLTDLQAFADAIDVMATQDTVTTRRQRERVFEFARLHQENSGDVEASRNLLRLALQSRR